MVRFVGPGPSHRRRHPGLRREALRAAGLADAAQRRRRGQPGLRAGGAPAAGQAAHRARRAGSSATTGCGWRAAAALAGTLTVLLVVRVGRRLTRSTLLGGLAGRAADLRRPLPRAVPDGHARRVLGAVRAGRVRHPALRPRRGARPDGASCVRRGPDRRLPVRPAARRALVAAAPPGCCSGWAARSSGRACTGWPRSRCCCCSGTSPRGGPPASSGRGVGTLVPRPGARRCGRWPLVPVLAYLSCWWAWFGSETGDRPARRRRARSAPAARGRSCPTRCAALWYYSGKVLDFHAGLTTAGQRGAPVGVQAVDLADGPAPDALLLRVRRAGHRLRRTDDCVSAVMLIGTPGAVVAGAAGARVRALAGGHPVRLALRRGAGRLRRGHPARGSPTSTARCTSSTWRRWCRSWCSATVLVMGEILGPAERRAGSAGRPGCWSSGSGSAWWWPTSSGCGRSSIGHADHPGDVGRAAVAAVLARLSAAVAQRRRPSSTLAAPSASPAPVSCSAGEPLAQHHPRQQHHHHRVERHDHRAHPQVTEPGGQQEQHVRRGVGHPADDHQHGDGSGSGRAGPAARAQHGAADGAEHAATRDRPGRRAAATARSRRGVASSPMKNSAEPDARGQPEQQARAGRGRRAGARRGQHDGHQRDADREQRDRPEPLPAQHPDQRAAARRRPPPTAARPRPSARPRAPAGRAAARSRRRCPASAPSAERGRRTAARAPATPPAAGSSSPASWTTAVTDEHRRPARRPARRRSRRRRRRRRWAGRSGRTSTASVQQNVLDRTAHWTLPEDRRRSTTKYPSKYGRLADMQSRRGGHRGRPQRARAAPAAPDDHRRARRRGRRQPRHRDPDRDRPRQPEHRHPGRAGRGAAGRGRLAGRRRRRAAGRGPPRRRGRPAVEQRRRQQRGVPDRHRPARRRRAVGLDAATRRRLRRRGPPDGHPGGAVGAVRPARACGSAPPSSELDPATR